MVWVGPYRSVGALGRCEPGRRRKRAHPAVGGGRTHNGGGAGGLRAAGDVRVPGWGRTSVCGDVREGACVLRFWGSQNVFGVSTRMRAKGCGRVHTCEMGVVCVCGQLCVLRFE